MDKQRILKEAQILASKFTFWMVSGNIAYLYGYAHETPEKKYEMEIKFDEEFPNSPPTLIFSPHIKDLIGEFQANNLKNWTPNLHVVDIIHEIKAKIQEALSGPVVIVEQELVPIKPMPEKTADSGEYLTPDLSAYPPDLPMEEYIIPESSNEVQFYEEPSPSSSPSEPSTPTTPTPSPTHDELITEPEEASIAVSTELGLIQQEYAYDQRGQKKGDINVYISITITKTFIIQVDFTNYPERPVFTFPEEMASLLGDPYKTLDLLKKWSPKKAPHVIEIIRELERRLYFIKDIELEAKKVLGEYQCDMVAGSISKLKVHLLTYGFKEYFLTVDLGPYPKPPEITLTPELQQIVQVPVNELSSYKNWKEKESEPVDVIREIQWLVDKNSRIKFEIDLIKANFKEVKYDPSSETLRLDMKGKMKSQDLTFEFQINLPREYPMKVPEIKVLNEFDIDFHEQIKNDLQASFKDFFNEWTPFSYLVDLFNVISEKIFEVSVVSCVICHKIECPSCNVKIAGPDACHAECPYCERSYHLHCWQQTISSFGKCGFCLKTPPPSMM